MQLTPGEEASASNSILGLGTIPIRLKLDGVGGGGGGALSSLAFKGTSSLL